MDSPTVKIPVSSGAPLHQVSPERINQQTSTQSSLSPEVAAHIQVKGSRPSSEVQAKIAFLNNLSKINNHAVQSTATTSSTTTAALQRAILGREEAESLLQSMTMQLSEANERERKVSERLESLIEDLHSLKERQAHERSIFEKEVRKARKEAFRAGSTLVKVQDDLKASKNEMRSQREEARAERMAKEKIAQNANEQAYALTTAMEEINTLKRRIQTLEAENQPFMPEIKASETLVLPRTRTPLLEIRAQSAKPQSTRRVNRPQSSNKRTSMNQQFATRISLGSPVKMESPRRSSYKENSDPKLIELEDDIDELRRDLNWERQLRIRAHDLIHFMKIECQFGRCSCRLAELAGRKYAHDKEWDDHYAHHHHPVIEIDTQQSPRQAPQSPRITPVSPVFHSQSPDPETVEAVQESNNSGIEFCPDTGTFRLSLNHAEENAEKREPRLSDAEAKGSVSPTLPSPAASTRVEHLVSSFIPQQADHRHKESSSQASYPHPDLPPSSLPSSLIGFSESSRSLPVKLPYDTQSDSIHTGAHTPTGEFPLTTNTLPPKTTTVSLHSEEKQQPALLCPVPGTPVTREKALAQIRARRSQLKRSASANDASSQLTSGREAKRFARGEFATRNTSIHGRRDISAPGGRL